MAIVQPLDYSLKTEDPIRKMMEGFQLGSTVGASIRAKEEAERKRVAQEQMQLEFNSVADMEDPAARRDAINKMMVKYPGMSENLKRGFDVASDEAKQVMTRNAIQIATAVNAGQPEIAQELISEQATALRNSGREAEAKHTELLGKLIKTTPGAARATTEMFLSATMDPEKYAKLVEDWRKGSVFSAEREVEKEQADLKKKAADLGLTNAQTNETIARTRKLGAETTKLDMELKALQVGGGLDPEKRFTFENQLRTQYQNLTTPVRQTQAAYQRIVDAEDNAAGDIALIFNYMKMLDPGSTVREGEFATAQNAAGIPTIMQNVYNKALSGTRLSPDQRKQMTNQSGKLFEGAKKQEEEIRKGMAPIIKDYGLKNENVFYAPEGLATPSPAAVPGAAPAAVPLPAGWTVTKR